MPWNPNLKKGVDLPVIDWLSFCPVTSNPGAGCAYDGSRFIYYAIQSGTTATTASTSQLWRFDTWNEGWQFLATLTSGNSGMDVEYDSVRNVVYITIGAALTAWQCFNLNTFAITIANQSIPPWAITTITLVLPAAAGAATSITMPDDLLVVGTLAANGATAIDSGLVAAGSTASSIVSSSNPGSFLAGMVGLYVRFTSGALAGVRRLIVAVPSPTTLTVTSFGSAPATNDSFVVEVPEGTATAGTTTTLSDTGQAWVVNQYRDADVIIIAGTGAGQRRRIGSNTATVLTLNAAVTGNPRTGPFSVAPDATSVYRIVPSSDFLYLQIGGGTAFYRLDVVATTGTAWSGLLAAVPAATGGGANTLYNAAADPFSINCLRGAATSTLYRYQIGLATWSTITTFAGSETFSTGASTAIIHGRRRLFIAKEGSQRTAFYDLTTGILEPGPFMPYSVPIAYDGHRSRFVKTPDGVEWLYHLRPGGQEFFRVALEWLV